MRDPVHLHPRESRDVSQYRKRNLRIAIRQLERAELYVVALNSLDLDHEAAGESIGRLIDHLRSLREYLLGLKASA